MLQAACRWNRRQSGALKIRAQLVHTGQHYDDLMSKVFFEDLGLPRPDVHLAVGSASHARQTAHLMTELERVLMRAVPDLVVVVGDVNSTLAAALVAAKEHIPVAHVEAGLRSGDRSMSEEVNRVVTDHVSDLLFTTSEAASDQLRAEGIAQDAVHFVGNTMIDTLDACMARVDREGTLQSLGLNACEYGLLTLHRPSNVDAESSLMRVLASVSRVACRVPILFPVHVRTRRGLSSKTRRLLASLGERVRVIEPLGYLRFLATLSAARFVLTDSGGIQAEACVIGTPCVTLRETTEWLETLQPGVNCLVDPGDGDALVACVDGMLSNPGARRGMRPDKWDGRASDRVIQAIAAWASLAE